MRWIKRSLLLLFTVFLLALVIPVGYFVLKDSGKEPNEVSLESYNGFITYVINLERSKSRWENILPNVQKFNFPVERIPAVDGYKLTEEEISRDVDIHSYNSFINFPLRVGIVGCALSHIKAWQTFLESNHEFAIIFEDDVILSPEKIIQIVSNLEKNKEYWDVVNLVTDRRGWPLTIKKFDDNTRLVVYLSRTTNAGAYIINRHAARQLLKKALPIVLPNDLYFSRGWELDLKYTGIEPRIPREIFGGSTVMTSKKNNQSNESNIKNVIIQNIFTFQTSVIRLIYNLWTFIKLVI